MKKEERVRKWGLRRPHDSDARLGLELTGTSNLCLAQDAEVALEVGGSFPVVFEVASRPLPGSFRCSHTEAASALCEQEASAA